MFKLSKKADYGLIAVKHLAMHRDQHACSATEIAEEYGISTMLMAKVLQKLARQHIVSAKHGASGGYLLAKEPVANHRAGCDFRDRWPGPDYLVRNQSRKLRRQR